MKTVKFICEIVAVIHDDEVDFYSTDDGEDHIRELVEGGLGVVKVQELVAGGLGSGVEVDIDLVEEGEK